MSRTKSLFDKSICARIKDLRLNLDLTGVKFAFNIGISQGFLSDVENCKAGPSKTLLIAISYVYNVNMGWLLTGEGQMTRGPELESDELVLHMDRGDPIRRHTQDANLPMEAITKEQAEARKAEKGGDDASILYKEEDTDPEVADLVLKTRQILTSGTGYSASLAANIRSFHNAMTTEATCTAWIVICLQ